MAKGSGAVRKAGRPQKITGTQVINKLGYEGASYPMDYVLGRSMTASDIRDVNKVKASISNSSQNDINYIKLDEAWKGNNPNYEVESTTVNISQLFANHQRYLNQETVAKYATSKDYNGVKAYKVSGSNAYVIHDGHHRLAAAIYNGESSINIEFIRTGKGFFKDLQKNKFQRPKK